MRIKHLLSFLFLLVCLPAFAVPVRSITAETSLMSEERLKFLFKLKEGDEFAEDKYEQAKEELERSPLFDKLEFIYKEAKDGVDIHIKADDKVFILPMAFVYSGKSHAFGISFNSGNILKRGDSAVFSAATSKDGFEITSGLSVGKHNFYASYSQLDFEQNFYNNGWESSKGLYSTAKDKNKNNDTVLGQVKGKQEDFSFTYGYKISSLWSVSLTPQYEYYSYQDGALDSGNHSTLSFGVQYADKVNLDMDMQTLDFLAVSSQKEALRDLSRVRTGKLAEVAYTAGGSWTGSDYEIQKISASGAYLWEMKTRHTIAVFVKGQRALKVPFSNEVESSELLFGLGIYDRQQRGKGGFSGGLAFTYFLLRDKYCLLGFTPFYEQAYVTSGGGSYNSHSGAGAGLTFRWWPVHLPVTLIFTRNLNDGTHHFGFKVGRKF